jgi:Ca2+-binding RTX toxin-like protein
MPIANELAINTSASALDMANAIFGDGITVTSASFQGDAVQSGIYSGALSTIAGIVPTDTGVILSTGNVTDFTNSSGATDTNTVAGLTSDPLGGINGDGQLNAVAGMATFDGAILNASFIPTGDMLTMQFVFTSEEYPEYVNGGVNDAFGVWINGSFVPATISVAGNISIDSVNGGVNQNLYRGNTADQFNTEMDGFTYVLSFKAPVTAGQVNTIKIGIADGGDAAFDSNLLIMGNSIQTFALAMDDRIQLTANSSRTFDILANDRDETDAGLTITQINGTAVLAGQVVTLATGEQVRLNADGTVTVFSDGDLGTNTLGYTVLDTQGNTDVGFIFIETVAVTGPDGIVQGSAGHDVIQVGYLGDPDGDRIDNNDGQGVGGTTADADYVLAGAGNDSITANLGNDIIYAGTGDDTAFGGAGRDWVASGEGNDSVDGGAGNDTIYGDGGNDNLSGGNDNDLIFGGAGRDTLFGGFNDDTLYGGEGHDSLSGGGQVDLLYGGNGNDTLDGGDNTDSVYGGAGDDLIVDLGGSLSDDFLYGGDGNDTISGGDREDLISGDAGNDQLAGDAGNDTIFGGAGNDTLQGGEGSDSLSGGDGRDTFFTGDITAAVGNDVVDGGDDYDVLDLMAWGHPATNILYDVNNPENGIVEFLDANGAVIGTMTFSNIESVVACFTPGAQVLTDQGELAVEDLQPGNLVLTRDNGYQPIRWTGRRDLSHAELIVEPRFNPVHIARGALGVGLPVRDMMVSPQHRMLVTGPRAELLFGENEVLVAAKHLVGLPGIEQRISRGVSYIHILFDQHEIVRADGAWSESFQPGDLTMEGMQSDQRGEIEALFPALGQGAQFQSARLTLTAREARALTTA